MTLPILNPKKHNHIFRVPQLFPFPYACSTQLFLQTKHCLVTWGRRGPQIAAPAAAAIAGGEGIKMCNLPPPRSLLSFSVSMLCPADVYPGPELIAVSGLGFSPILLSLKPSSFCKTMQGRHTESVGLALLEIMYVASKKRNCEKYLCF